MLMTLINDNKIYKLGPYFKTSSLVFHDKALASEIVNLIYVFLFEYVLEKY